MEELVTIEIERAVTGIEGVREVRSCTRPGASVVDVTFSPETTGPTALVRAAVRALDLPTGASEPVIEALPDPSTLAAIVDIFGDAGRPALEMAARQLETELNGTIGTKLRVRITGVRREMQIALDAEPARDMSLDIEPTNSAAGPSRSTTQQEDEIVVQTQGRESVLVEVFARTRQGSPAVSEQTRSVVERLRAKGDKGMEFHAADCTANPSVFTVAAECEDLPAKTIAGLFAARLAADYGSVEGVEHVHSESVRGEVTIRFEVGRDHDVETVLRQVKRIPARPGASISQPMPFPPMAVARIDVHGKTIDEMLPLAHKLRSEVSAVAGVARVAAPALRPPSPQLQIRVRREKAAAYGLSARTVAEFIETALSGQAVQDHVKELQDLQIPVADTFVPLRALVEVVMGAAPPARFRLNGRPTITLYIAPEVGQKVDPMVRHLTAIVKETRSSDSSITIDLTMLTDSRDPAINATPQPR